MEEKYIIGGGGVNALVLDCYWAGKTERTWGGGHAAQINVIKYRYRTVVDKRDGKKQLGELGSEGNTISKFLLKTGI
jgi:hypothetical protein